MPATILVIDDDAYVRDALCAMLARVGYAPVPAPSGHHALSQIDRGRVDAVLTDLFMPDMDGFEVLRAIRARRPTLPVVAVSGMPQGRGVNFLDMISKLSVDAVLHKPVTQDGLSRTFGRLLTQGRG